MITWRLTVAGTLLTALLRGPELRGQVLASVDAVNRGCAGADDLAERLRKSHPQAAAQIGSLQCLGEATVWTPTSPLDREQRTGWQRAVRALEGTGEPRCLAAAATLRRLDRDGRVSVWTAADTTAGLVYYGASYLAADSSPLAVQFWAPAFDRPVSWLAGAMAHEAFHLFEPEASEAEAVAFGSVCSRAGGQGSRPDPILAGALPRTAGSGRDHIRGWL